MPGKRNIYNYGFTLLELLVVIVVIGILATLILGSFSGTQQQTRDTRRKSDLKYYQGVLQNYANRSSGFYVTSTTAADMHTICGNSINLLLEPNVQCPTDPQNTGAHVYKYISNNVAGRASQYLIYTQLEEQTGGIMLYQYYCSTGKNGTQTSLPTILTCS